MQHHGFSISPHAGSSRRTYEISSHPHSDYSLFHMLLDPSNATTPVGWYPEPSFRGTYSLLSSCVSTLLICVLSAVHLDVPAVHHNRLHKWAKKAKWVAIGVFAPEWLTMTAYLEWQNARGLVSKANDTLTFADSNAEASKAITKYLKPRLLQAKLYDPEAAEKSRFSISTYHASDSTGSLQGRRQRWELVHGFYASTGGFCLQTSENTVATLTAQGVEYLIKEAPDSIPDISSKEVRDKSKHDSLAKCLALIQVLWFSAECLTRLAQDLPVSLLELNTFVHTLFALITYMLWWKKPFNVDVPTTIPRPDDSHIATLLEGHDPGSESSRYLRREGISKPFLVRLKWCHLFCGTANPFHVDQSDPIQCHLRVMISSFFGALYGALHISAWYYPFPTQVECVIWRVSVSCIVVCGLTVSLSQALAVLRVGHKTRDGTGMRRLVAIKLMAVNFAAAYSILISCFARFFIVMESFRSVWFLPAAAYTLPEWSRYMPHFD